MPIGKCKHGEFELIQGCKECIAERVASETKTYKVGNKFSHERATVTASSAQEACAKMGWYVRDCWVTMLPKEEV